MEMKNNDYNFNFKFFLYFFCINIIKKYYKINNKKYYYKKFN